MPLVKCPDCGRMISDLSTVCIGCGRPTLTISKEHPSNPPSPIESNSAGKPSQSPEEQKRTINDSTESTRTVTKEEDLVPSVSAQAISSRDEQSKRSEMLAATTWYEGLSPADRKRFETLVQTTPQQRKDSCFACNGQKGVCHTCNSREVGYRKYLLATGSKPKEDIPVSIRSRQLEPPMHFKVRAKGFDYSGGTLENIRHRIAIGELPEDVWLMGSNSSEWRRPSEIIRGDAVTAQKQKTAGTPAQTIVTVSSAHNVSPPQQPYSQPNVQSDHPAAPGPNSSREQSFAANISPPAERSGVIHKKGVGGWLALLIAGMLFLGPCVSLGRVGSDFSNAEGQYKDLIEDPTWNQFKRTTWIVTITLSAYMSISGWLLYRKFVRSSVKNAKIAIWVCGPLLTAIISIFLPAHYYGESGIDFGSSLGAIIGSTFGATIWTAYLSLSKRVKATYIA